MKEDAYPSQLALLFCSRLCLKFTATLYRLHLSAFSSYTPDLLILSSMSWWRQYSIDISRRMSLSICLSVTVSKYHWNDSRLMYHANCRACTVAADLNIFHQTCFVVIFLNICQISYVKQKLTALLISVFLCAFTLLYLNFVLNTGVKRHNELSLFTHTVGLFTSSSLLQEDHLWLNTISPVHRLWGQQGII